MGQRQDRQLMGRRQGWRRQGRAAVESAAGSVADGAGGVGLARVMGVCGWLAWAMRVATTAGPRDS